MIQYNDSAQVVLGGAGPLPASGRVVQERVGYDARVLVVERGTWELPSKHVTDSRRYQLQSSGKLDCMDIYWVLDHEVLTVLKTCSPRFSLSRILFLSCMAHHHDRVLPTLVSNPEIHGT